MERFTQFGITLLMIHTLIAFIAFMRGKVRRRAGIRYRTQDLFADMKRWTWKRNGFLFTVLSGVLFGLFGSLEPLVSRGIESTGMEALLWPFFFVIGTAIFLFFFFSSIWIVFYFFEGEEEGQSR